MAYFPHPSGSADRSRSRERGLDYLFNLNSPVGPRAMNDPSDVDKVESLLAATGHHDPSSPGKGAFGPDLDKSIRRYQKGAELAVDGLLNPGGPTISTLGHPRRRIAGFTPEARAVLTTLPGLPADAVSDNERTAAALRRTGDFGPMPGYVAEARLEEAGAALVEAGEYLQELLDKKREAEECRKRKQRN